MKRRKQSHAEHNKRYGYNWIERQVFQQLLINPEKEGDGCLVISSVEKLYQAMLRALRKVIGKSSSLCVNRFRLGQTQRTLFFNSYKARPFACKTILVANYVTNKNTQNMTPSIRELLPMKLVNGKVPLSLFESNAYLDYEKYERTLKIVKERYTVKSKVVI